MKILHVIRVVEFLNLVRSGSPTVEDAHVLGKLVVFDQAVCHAHALWLHGVVRIENIGGDIIVVDIGDWLH